MKHDEAYRIPDIDDMGTCDNSSFLLVNSVGYYEFTEVTRPTHRKQGRNDYYMAYNHHGNMKIRMSGHEYQLEPGSVFIYRPHEEQYYGHGKNKAFMSHWVHFTGYGVEELLSGAGLSEKCVFNVGISKTIANIYEAMLLELKDKNPGYELMVSSFLINLVAVIARKLDPEFYGNLSESRKEIHDSVRYINNNYDKRIYIKELAEMAHLCPDRYTCIFKEVMGITPLQYIINLRIQKSCELIRRTSLGIGQIAAMVGFDDQLYFSRLFKKNNGLSPSKYRAKFENHD
jgi:AraC family transcriptional regulator of arabinose operon